MNQYKVGTEFKVKVDTKMKCFGCSEDFKLLYFSDNDDLLIKKDCMFIEIASGDIVYNSKIIEEALVGSQQIKVEENHTFKIYDVIKIKDEYYIILEVNSNVITLNKKLVETCLVDDVVDYSNLTGIYETSISFDSTGIYNIIVRNMKNFKSLISSVEIVSETLNEKLSTDKTFI